MADPYLAIPNRGAIGRQPNQSEMIRISGGTFRMGSDRHYPEEAPVHRVTVDGFWIERTPVTNRQFREFVRSTGHVTVAEITPDPKDYPAALPHLLFAGSLVFSPPDYPVDLRHFSQWWTFKPRVNWRRPYGPGSSIKDLDDHPVVHVAYSDAVYLRPGTPALAKFLHDLGYTTGPERHRVHSRRRRLER